MTGTATPVYTEYSIHIGGCKTNLKNLPQLWTTVPKFYSATPRFRPATPVPLITDNLWWGSGDWATLDQFRAYCSLIVQGFGAFVYCITTGKLVWMQHLPVPPFRGSPYLLRIDLVYRLPASPASSPPLSGSDTGTFNCSKFRQCLSRRIFLPFAHR